MYPHAGKWDKIFAQLLVYYCLVSSIGINKYFVTRSLFVISIDKGSQRPMALHPGGNSAKGNVGLIWPIYERITRMPMRWL